MSSVNISTLSERYGGADLSVLASAHIDENFPMQRYRWAVSYTSEHSLSDEPTHIGFACYPSEALQYMSLRNAQLLLNRVHQEPPESTEGIAFSHQDIQGFQSINPTNLQPSVTLRTYYYYDAVTEEKANHFLERQSVNEQFLYIVVRAPGRTMGRDMNGTYEI